MSTDNIAPFPTLVKRIRKALTPLPKATFDTMTIPQKRVAIARDLLERLDTERIKANWGKVILAADIGLGQYAHVSAARVQAILNDPPEPCYACAKGALLATWVGLFDSVDSRTLNAYSTFSVNDGYPEELVATFGTRLMAALEIAFEGEAFSWNRRVLEEPEYRALETAFPMEDNVQQRLKAIYENVIAHEGALVITTAAGVTHTFA